MPDDEHKRTLSTMSRAQALLYYSAWQKYRLHKAPNRGYRHEACVICDTYEFVLKTLVEMSQGQAKRDLSDRKTFYDVARSVRKDDVTIAHPFSISLQTRAELWLSLLKVANDLGGQHA